MNRTYFWLSALGVALALAVLLLTLFPYGALGIEAGAARHRAWLLTLWTSGVLAICFGASGLLSVIAPISFRDVHEAGSVMAAIETHREDRLRRTGGFYNFAGWTVATGGSLILVYFSAWLAF